MNLLSFFSFSYVSCRVSNPLKIIMCQQGSNNRYFIQFDNMLRCYQNFPIVYKILRPDETSDLGKDPTLED